MATARWLRNHRVRKQLSLLPASTFGGLVICLLAALLAGCFAPGTAPDGTTPQCAEPVSSQPAAVQYSIIDTGTGLIAVRADYQLTLMGFVEAENQEQAISIWENRDTATQPAIKCHE